MKDQSSTTEQQSAAAKTLGDDAVRGNGLAAIALQQGYAKSNAKDAILGQADRISSQKGELPNQQQIDHNMRLLRDTAASAPEQGRRGIDEAKPFTSYKNKGMSYPRKNDSAADLHARADKSLKGLAGDDTISKSQVEWMRNMAQHPNADDALRQKLHEGTKDMKLPDSYRNPSSSNPETRKRLQDRTDRMDRFRADLGKSASTAQAREAIDQMADNVDFSSRRGQKLRADNYGGPSEKFNRAVDEHLDKNPAERRNVVDSNIDELRSGDTEDARRAGEILKRNADHLSPEQLNKVTEGVKPWNLSDDKARRDVVSKALTEGQDPKTRTAAARKLLEAQSSPERYPVRDLNYQSVSVRQPAGMDLSETEKSAIATEAAANPDAFQRMASSGRRALDSLQSSPLTGTGLPNERVADGHKYTGSQEFRDRLKMAGAGERRTSPGEARTETFNEEIDRIRSSGGRAEADKAVNAFRAQNQSYAETLSSDKASAKQKQQAAQNLAASPTEMLNKGQLDSLKSYAAAQGDTATRRMTLEHLKDQGPMGASELAPRR